jgi:pilus assembly protein CpaB
MRPKSLVLLILALGCGLVASIGINQVLAKRNAEPDAPTTEMVPIFVAKANIDQGQQLRPDMVNLEDWPKNKVPDGTFSKLEDLQDRTTKVMCLAGEPIREAKLFGKGETGEGASKRIPAGWRVMAVRVDDVSGGGLLLPGDRVDVMVYIQSMPGQPNFKPTTKTFLQRIRVFAVDAILDRDGNPDGAIPAKTISLLLSPEQAEMVTLASEVGKIRLVMRSATDEGNEDTKSSTADDILKGTAGANTSDSGNDAKLKEYLDSHRPPTPTPVVEAPVVAPKTSTFQTTVIEGTTVRVVDFPEGGQPQTTIITAPASGDQTPPPGDVKQPTADETKEGT